jgi:hypothetical protein
MSGDGNDSVLEDYSIYHYHDEELVDVTVLNASKSFGKSTV